jgi:integrase
MTALPLKYVDSFIDRCGRRRHYFRRNHGPRVLLPGLPGSPEFMDAYQQALGREVSQREVRQRGEPGTFDRLVQDYYASSAFAHLRPATRSSYRRVIDRLIRDENIGHRLVRQMLPSHVDFIIAKRAAKPGAANDVLKKLRVLINFANAKRWRIDDPTKGVKKFAEGEFHTWTDEQVAAYEARWAIGTKERTAFALLLFTAQRLGDVRGMTWRDLADGGINVVQSKTRARLWIPLHPELHTVLDAWPRTHVAIFVTEYGQPFSSKGFANWMADRIAEAGLPDECVVHGLRKAAARRLAEAGCSEHQIASITGHTSLKEIERYTKEANQKVLAAAAIGKLSARKSNTESQTSVEKIPNSKKS